MCDGSGFFQKGENSRVHLVALCIMKACSSTKFYLKAIPLLSITLFMVLVIKLCTIPFKTEF